MDGNTCTFLSGGGESIDVSKVAQTTPHTSLRLVEPASGWLAREGAFAADDKHGMRVFVIDDFHKDVFQRELAQLSQGEYLRLKADGKAQVAIESIAQQLVEEVRGCAPPSAAPPAPSPPSPAPPPPAAVASPQPRTAARRATSGAAVRTSRVTVSFVTPSISRDTAIVFME